MSVSNQQTLKALPVQVIETEKGVILKRGCTQLRISGEGSLECIKKIFWITSTQQATPQEIIQNFSTLQRQNVQTLIEQLIIRRFLVAGGKWEGTFDGIESHEEIFYWNFGESKNSISKKLNDQKIVILGVNYISRQLIFSLLSSGFTNFDVVDFPLLRNLRLFDSEGHLDPHAWNFSNASPLEFSLWIEKENHQDISCMVGTADFGNHEVMQYLNKICLESNFIFLPVVLQNLVGYVGPLTVPGETACFECLRSRQNANCTDPDLEQAIEEKAFEGQIVVGFHPSMASILGDIAALELTRFYSGTLPGRTVGYLIEVNLLATFMKVRNILKIPRCKACSPFLTRPPVQLKKPSIQLPGVKR